ncbi:MAG: YgiQ family radical SAM protein [Deltaproteobacteria bacterium]|nr:YgiQ family radical SAM protein [Deltaproteobacteria bacterium]
MFLPTTQKEMNELGWDGLDIILITGDGYIDSPFVGVAVIGKILLDAGYRVGIIAQPDRTSGDDISRLGEPRLFWGVTGGCIDSMVANYTATGRKRKRDDYTPGNVNNRRPDRATIVYSNLIRTWFKETRPIVLGGIEASLRRIAHYDFWSDTIRRSILFDAKADYLLYGMADRSVVELAACLKAGGDPRGIRGLCYASPTIPEGCLKLPSFDHSAQDTNAFTEMFHLFYRNNDPMTALPLAQKQDTRYLIQTPPAHTLESGELDAVHDIDYERELHPYYRNQGEVKALETIRFSIATHRGCYGECNFCSISVHQGRRVTSRSRASILNEARAFTLHPRFKGIIQDVGGPTANMYGIDCDRREKQGSCPDKRCLFPEICPRLTTNHGQQISLLKALRAVNGVKKVFIASGIRHDLILADTKHGREYLKQIIRHHVSGQMKLAPEHSETRVLEKMGKSGRQALLSFREFFFDLTKKEEKNLFLTYYLIAAHPGCTDDDMKQLRSFALRDLKLLPEQVQVFTPTPSTYSTLMYWTEHDPFTGEPCFVEKTYRGRARQKNILADHRTRNQRTDRSRAKNRGINR